MCGGPETEQTHTLSVLDACNPKTTKTDDAGTQERCGVQIIQPIGKGKDKIGTGECILGVSAVHGIAGKSSRIAQVLKVVLAIPALPISPANPGNSDAGARRQAGRSAFDDLTNDLMTRNQFFTEFWKLAFHDVQIGTADTACAHP
jgi:hypothetical protein